MMYGTKVLASMRADVPILALRVRLAPIQYIQLSYWTVKRVVTSQSIRYLRNNKLEDFNAITSQI